MNVSAQIDDQNFVSNVLNLFLILFQLTFFCKKKVEREELHGKDFLSDFFEKIRSSLFKIIRLNQISFLRIEIDSHWMEK